jgi:tRNA(Ile)-lysidine synthase
MNRNIRNRFLVALLEQIESQSLFCLNDRWLLAVSGGPDSMALLHGLLELQRDTEWPGPQYLHLAHLNHQLRGAESDADAEFVRTQAKKLGLDCTIGSVNIAEAAKAAGESLETTARNERYKFLARTALQNQCNKIALAHNADDQAETILHRILRGTGVRGLTGIPTKRTLEEYGPTDQPLVLIRPLLKVNRQEIEDFLQEENIPYRIDKSNLSSDHTRNHLRNELLPLLREQYNPQVNQALTRLGQTAEWMTELLNQDAQAALSELTLSRTENSLCLDLPGLQAKTTIQQTELIHVAMQELSIPMRPIGFTHIHALLELIAAEEDSPRILDLPHRLRATRKTTQLIMETGFTAAQSEENWVCFEILLPEDRAAAEGCVWGYIDKKALEIWNIRAKSFAAGGARFESFRRTKTAREEMIDPAGVQGALKLRTWREGDCFTPLGAGGEKTLGDFFTDAKVPVEYRRRIGLVCDDAGIVWVIGLRIADRVKITPHTRKILKLTVE